MNELTHMMDAVIRKDKNTPDLYKPIIAIGHTKDLVDLDTVESFLSYLERNGITVSTFDALYKDKGSKLQDIQHKELI